VEAENDPKKTTKEDLIEQLLPHIQINNSAEIQNINNLAFIRILQ